MSVVPNGWTEATLGDLGRYINGRGFKKSEWAESGRPIIRIQNLTGTSDQFNYFDGVADERHVVRRGDLLVSWAATLGVYRWTGEEAVLNQHIFKVESHIDPDFHRYLVQRALDDLYRQAHGSGMVHITKGKFHGTPVLLPPLAEQERIVAAIEEHFSHLDAAEASLRRGQRSLERLRLSTLMEICSGTWPVQQLGAVAATLRNGMFVSRPAADPPGVPIFRISAVRPLALDSNDVRYAQVSAEDAVPFRVEEGDLLFTRYSGNPSYVGACAVVPAGAAGTLHPDKLIRVSLDQTVALPSWVAIYLSVGAGRAQIDARLKTTAGQVGIAGGQLKTVEVPLPPVDEQVRRIARWDAASDQMSAMSSDIEGATRRASNLRRSILAAAFSGQLVPQDAAEESADALLERIREAAAANKPSRKRKPA